MIDEPLPLLTLFNRLRQAGLPLGLAEYQLALQAFQAGFGLSDQAAMARLCRSLWIKSMEERLIFDYHFEQLMGQSAEALRAKALREDIALTQRITRQSQQITMRGMVVAGVIGILILCGLYFRPNQLGIPVPPEDSIPTPEISPPAPNPEPPTETSPEETTGVSWLAVLLTVATVGGSVLLLRWILRWLANSVKSDSNLDEKTGKDSSPSPLEQIQDMQDEVQLAQVVQPTSVPAPQMAKPQLIRVGEYFPITTRQLKQGWRYLRRPIREGPKTEFDLEATVQQIGQQGMLLEPVFVPPRKNRTELILLIDQNGSMVPFHGLARRISDTALRAGRLGKAGIYYFHNCPIDYLYRDPNFQRADALQDFLNEVISRRSVVLIFSDAGSARGGLNRKRVELTIDFLRQLDQQASRVAWLNPLPSKRWQGNTAAYIAEQTSMFEVSRQDFQGAINILRGRRVTNATHRGIYQHGYSNSISG